MSPETTIVVEQLRKAVARHAPRPGTNRALRQRRPDHMTKALLAAIALLEALDAELENHDVSKCGGG